MNNERFSTNRGNRRWLLSSLLAIGLASTVNAQQMSGSGLPGQWENGKCLTFAEAYAEQHSGSKLIVMVKLPKAHVVVQTASGSFLDNLHPYPSSAKRLIDFYEANRYESRGWHIMTVIDWDTQTDQDSQILAYLKSKEQ